MEVASAPWRSGWSSAAPLARRDPEAGLAMVGRYCAPSRRERLLLAQPDRAQGLRQVIARRHDIALHGGGERHDPPRPQERHGIGLLEQPRLELAHGGAAVGGIRRARLAVE